MRISIEFDSSWQTGFLDGEHDKPVSRTNPRKFVATTSTKGEKPTPITKNTVMGVLCRLVGDQRKLYQAKNSNNYYFSELEPQVSFTFNKIHHTSQKLMYLTNKSDSRCAQSTFLGVLSSDNPWFFSKVAPKLWSVLFLDKNKLLDFILKQEIEDSEANCSPKNLIARINVISNTKQDAGSVLKIKKRLLFEKTEEIEKKQKLLNTTIQKAKDKPPKSQSQITKHESKINDINEAIMQLKEELSKIEVDRDINKRDSKITGVINFLSNKFPDNDYLTNDVIYPIRLYAAALYLQAERLLNHRNDLLFLKDQKGNIAIQGFSKRGFNGIRDWLNPMTAGRKKAVGTPCLV